MPDLEYYQVMVVIIKNSIAINGDTTELKQSKIHVLDIKDYCAKCQQTHGVDK